MAVSRSSLSSRRCRPPRLLRTRVATPGRRSRSASTSPSAVCGAKPSTAGKRPSSSIRAMPPRSTTWRLPTSTRASWAKRARPTKKRWSSTRTTRRSNRTSSSSRKSMTAPVRRKSRKNHRLLAGALAALGAATIVACGPDTFEIPIETPIQPKLDVSAFQRVLVAGFVAGGTEDLDTNQETVRLLRGQLRNKSSLKVIDADVMPLMDIAQDQNKTANAAEGASSAGSTEAAPAGPAVAGAGSSPSPTGGQALPLPQHIKDEKDLEPYERLFANVTYWKMIGEEYQNPLIVTGTVLFMPNSRSGFVQRDQEVYDQFGRRSVRPIRTYMERKGFVLRPKFVFIDGRTGATMYSESYREEILYNAQQNTPALSSYFELMDRLVPNFLSTLSSQKIKGTRVLLK